MAYKFEGIDNCSIIVSPAYDFEKLMEIKSVRQFMIALNGLLTRNFRFFVFWGTFEDESFLLEHCDTKSQCENVLFWIGDEHGNIPSPEVFSRYSCVFKVHLRDKDAVCLMDGVNVYRPGLYHFPLLTVDDVPVLPVQPYSERNCFVYFNGNLNKNRFTLFAALSKAMTFLEASAGWLALHNVRGSSRFFEKVFRGKSFDFSDSYPHSSISFYNGFNNGDDYAVYARKLQNAKVVLSPCGFSSTECFRLYEAMRQGCIVITEPLPRTSFYLNAPVLTLASWDDLNEVLCSESVLSRYDPLEIRRYYDGYLSPEGIAGYVAAILCER